MSKITVKAVAGVIVVFLLGVITGVLGTGLAIRHGIREFAERAPETQRTLVMRRLTRELNLTDAQRPQVEAIVQAGGRELRNLLQQSHHDFSQFMTRKTAELKEILTPEQQQKLDRMIEHIQKRWPPLPQ